MNKNAEVLGEITAQEIAMDVTVNDDENIKKRYMNSQQKELLLEFIVKNPDLKSGKFTATFTRKVCQKLWMDVTKLLNSVPCGAQKSADQWKRVEQLNVTLQHFNTNFTNSIP